MQRRERQSNHSKRVDADPDRRGPGTGGSGGGSGLVTRRPPPPGVFGGPSSAGTGPSYETTRRYHAPRSKLEYGREPGDAH
jgi:hypothetical protein